MTENELHIYLVEKVTKLSKDTFLISMKLAELELNMISLKGELKQFLDRVKENSQKQLVCPRCKGQKRTLVHSVGYNDLNHMEPCKYCLGEGFIK